MSARMASLLLLFTSSCAWTRVRIGVPLPDSSSMQIGVSTKADVLRILGPPPVMRRQFDGELYTWRYTESHRKSLKLLPALISVFFYSDGELREDDLTMFFDRQGVLQAMGVRKETHSGDD